MLEYVQFFCHTLVSNNLVLGSVLLISQNVLYLYDNALTGTIPSEIGLLTNLGECRMLFTTPFCCFCHTLVSNNLVLGSVLVISQMSYIFIDNALTGTIPSEISSMTNLGECVARAATLQTSCCLFVTMQRF